MPAPTATPSATNRSAPTILVPQTNPSPKPPPAARGVFGQPEGALDGLARLWLPAVLVLLVLLRGAAHLVSGRRKRDATIWTKEGGCVTMPDADAAKLHLTELTEATDEDPAPAPAAEVAPELTEEVLEPVEPLAESAVPPLIPSFAPSAGSASHGAHAVPMRPPAGPGSPAATRQPSAPPPPPPEATLQRFVEDWSGVSLETDGDPYPSMALLRTYASEVLGAPPVWGTPNDLPDTYDMDHYVWVGESPYRVAAPGDVIVWAPRPEDVTDGGHVAIFIKGDASGFDAFDAVRSVPSVRHHADYRNVVGWLHPIGKRKGAGASLSRLPEDPPPLTDSDYDAVVIWGTPEALPGSRSPRPPSLLRSSSKTDLVVDARGLGKRYGPIVAVDGVDMRVERGEVYGFLGPNGAGKTTTLRMLAGLIRPTSGTATVAGGAPGTSESLEHVGCLIEAPAFYPYLSGRDNLRVIADYSGVARSAIEPALETVELAPRASDKLKTYSQGMKQRLGVAAAVLKNPDLLILDEPTNGLDPQGMADMRGLITRLGQGNRTVLVSSHLLAEVEQMCTRIGVIQHGKVIAEGTVDELRRGPSTLQIQAEPKETAREVLAREVGAEHVLHENGFLQVHVEASRAGALNRALVQEGVEVSHLAMATRSLEDAFLELTGGETGL